MIENWKVRVRLQNNEVQYFFVEAVTVGEACDKAFDEVGYENFKSFVSASVIK